MVPKKNRTRPPETVTAEQAVIPLSVEPYPQGMYDPERKLARSERFFDQLLSEYFAWQERSPKTYEVAEDANVPGRFVVTARGVEMPPIEEWALLVGDFVHHARTALDHLAYRVLHANNPGGLTPAQEKTSAFPIYSNEKAFRQGNWGSAFFTVEQVAALLSVQPFPQRTSDQRDFVARMTLRKGLFYLSRLDNVDKHRETRLPIPRAVARWPPSEVLQRYRMNFWSDTPVDFLQEGSEIGHFYVNEPDKELSLDGFDPAISCRAS